MITTKRSKYKEMTPEELKDLKDHLMKSSDELKIAAMRLIMRRRIEVKIPKHNWYVTPWKA